MSRKKLWMIITAAVVAVAVAGGGAYFLLRTKGSPKATAQAFLAGWQRGDTPAMRDEVAAPPADFDSQYRALKTLGVSRVRANLGKVTKAGGRTVAPFSAELQLPSGPWRYQGRLQLAKQGHGWKVAWTPEAIHPDLHAGQHLTTAHRWAKRGRVFAAGGAPIDGTDVSGSVQQLVGSVGPATKDEIKKLGVQAGDPVGRGGVQERFAKRLAGRPTLVISTADGQNHAVKTVGTIAGQPGQNVKTSIDLRIEKAAADAVRSQSKPTSFVAIRPSTGQVLAVANVPGGFDRAVQGTYPPGSTFKVVTAYALLHSGMTPGSKVSCPKTATIGGQKIHNSEGEELGNIDLKEALAQSCNTAFALQTEKHLSARTLASTAGLFGFNQKLTPGFGVTASGFPTPQGPSELAAAAFGQARDTSNALGMAGVAAAVANGTWHPPALITDPQVPQPAKPNKLDGGITAQLAGMMRAVVTHGTAKDAGLPAGTFGKTGTAEFGTGKKLKSHAWFMGYRGDVAFAVVVEGGGFGGKVAAPLAAKFLKAL